MTCPVCGGKTYVASTIKCKNTVARRRLCTNCGYAFYTDEVETDSGKYQKGRNLKKLERLK